MMIYIPFIAVISSTLRNLGFMGMLCFLLLFLWCCLHLRHRLHRQNQQLFYYEIIIPILEDSIQSIQKVQHQYKNILQTVAQIPLVCPDQASLNDALQKLAQKLPATQEKPSDTSDTSGFLVLHTVIRTMEIYYQNQGVALSITLQAPDAVDATTELALIKQLIDAHSAHYAQWLQAKKASLLLSLECDASTPPPDSLNL